MKINAQQTTVIISFLSIITFIIFLVLFNKSGITVENLIALIAIVIGFGTLNISLYFNKKTLEQTEKNLIAKLLYEDEKQALFELSKIIKESKYRELRSNVFTFIKTTKGQYVPDKIVKLVYEKIADVEKFINKESPYKEPEPTQEELEQMEIESYEAEYHMTPSERFEKELSQKIASLKAEILSETHKKLKKPI